MNFTCPACFAQLSVETALESASGRELMGVLAQTGPMARSLAAYLGCFRSANRALSWDRALKLAREVLALEPDQRLLAAALADTVEALRAKREAGDLRPLKNHNYLKQVLKSVQIHATAVDSLPSPSGRGAGGEGAKGKRRQAIDALRDWAGVNAPLLKVLANGLSGLVALSRPGTPAADTITLTADLWLHWARKQGLVDTPEDCERLYTAFSGLLAQALKEWPEPAALAAHLPKRKPQPRIEQHVSDENHAASAAALASLRERL